ERSERYHLEDNNVIFGLHNPVHPNPFFANAAVPEAIDFNVYKLDQEWARWVDVKNWRDQVFILSNDGFFSVSTRGLARVKGNCILFTDHRHAHLPGVAGSGARKCHSCVFDLEDGSIKNVAAFRACFMLWPPSSWLSPD
ncbi:PREDICTED: F-box, partial [Prunus dulcis]